MVTPLLSGAIIREPRLAVAPLRVTLARHIIIMAPRLLRHVVLQPSRPPRDRRPIGHSVCSWLSAPLLIPIIARRSAASSALMFVLVALLLMLALNVLLLRLLMRRHPPMRRALPLSTMLLHRTQVVRAFALTNVPIVTILRGGGTLLHRWRTSCCSWRRRTGSRLV